MPGVYEQLKAEGIGYAILLSADARNTRSELSFCRHSVLGHGLTGAQARG
jgi:hypothetical protein